MCQNTFNIRLILKYADDSVIVNLLRRSEKDRGLVVDNFVKWCEDSHLQLNLTRTKDMAVDFRRNAKTPEPVRIKGQLVTTSARN